MSSKNQLRRLTKHIDHELREFLRVGRLIQSGQYQGSQLYAPLRETFASHFPELCEFFAVERLPGKYPDAKASHYARQRCYRAMRVRRRMFDADKLQAHLGPGRLVLCGRRSEWGEERDTSLFLPKIRQFIGKAERAGFAFPQTSGELTFGSPS